MKLASEETVRKRIDDALRESVPDDATRADIAFHMTDWRTDLEEIIRLYSEDEISGEEVENTVFGFLIHVPNHVAAAKKLIGLGPMEDIFGVGVKDNE